MRRAMKFNFPVIENKTTGKTVPDYFYDRSIRSWTFRMVDSNCNQIGDAEFYCSKRELQKRLDEVSNEKG